MSPNAYDKRLFPIKSSQIHWKNGYFFSLVLITKTFWIHQFSCKELLMIAKKLKRAYIFEKIFKFASIKLAAKAFWKQKFNLEELFLLPEKEWSILNLQIFLIFSDFLCKELLPNNKWTEGIFCWSAKSEKYYETSHL